jgi:ribosomal protein L7/L12
MTTEPEFDPKFKELVQSTADLVKTGNIDAMVKRFKAELGEDSPTFIGSMRMMAGAMKAKGNTQAAHKIYKNIHDIMVRQGGETQVEVLKAYMDVISTNNSIKDAYDMTRHGKKLADKSDDNEIKEQFETIRSTIFESLSSVQQRLYTKLDNREVNIKTDMSEKSTGNCDIDDVITQFGLEEYIAQDEKRKKKTSRSKKK